MKPSIVLAVAVAVIVPTAAAAQSITSGSLTGRVQTVTGEPIGDAIVHLRDLAGGRGRGRGVVEVTDAEGRFGFALLPPGDYTVTAEQLGYMPRTLSGIVIVASGNARVTVVLEETEPPVTTVDTAGFTGGAVGADPGGSRTYPPFGVTRMPWSGRMLFELNRLSTSTLGPAVIEGLTSTSTWMSVEGNRLGVARHPVLPATELTMGAVPLLGLREATLVTGPADLEWGGFAGGVLNATPLRGTADLRVSVFGDWVGNPGASSDYFDPNARSHSSFRGGAVITGPVIKDTLQFAVGGEYQRVQMPVPSPWIATGSEPALVTVAADSFSVDLARYVVPQVVERRVGTGFVRFDAQVDRHAIYLWSSLTDFEEDLPPTGRLGIAGVGTKTRGTDITAGVLLASRLSRVFRNEVRIGFARTTRDYGDNGLPGTWVGGAGVRFGTDASQPGDVARTDFTLSDALHIGLGTMQLKLGGAVAVASHNLTFGYATLGEYTFSDADAFGSGNGALVLATGTTLPARWSSTHLTVFLQNTWSPTPRLDLIFGVRWDGEYLPAEKVVPNSEWAALTGLANDSLPSFRSKWSPRFATRWRTGPTDEWVVQFGAGIYYDAVDPAVLAELISESGRLTVRRGIGAVGGWPDPTGAMAGQEVGSRLTLLGPNYQAPRSGKLSFGIARRVGKRGVIEIAANYRRTNFLPRRHDLNRLQGPAARDQYGRPIYGSLVKSGGVLGPDPASYRRFDGFELVSALDADGVSDYWGVTARLDVPVGRFGALLASYTYSQTTDNWLSGSHGGPYAQLTPFPDSLNGRDWADGRSDFDVPHRVTLGVEVNPLGRPGLTIGALYRFQSGLPFTPGFRYGVDINADGSAGNDPAYVDEGIPGVTELLGEWDCLREHVGQFVERNACRGPGRSSLDLRLGLGPVSLASYPVELWIEFLNVTETEFAIRDNALYLVDPAAPLAVDPVAGTVTVPLLANDGFGKPVAFRGQGRSVRFGLRVNY